MWRASREQLEQRAATYLARWRKAKRLQLPSWWRLLAPERGPRFWSTVEAMRKEAGITRGDQSGIAYIVNQLRRKP